MDPWIRQYPTSWASPSRCRPEGFRGEELQGDGLQLDWNAAFVADHNLELSVRTKQKPETIFISNRIIAEPQLI